MFIFSLSCNGQVKSKDSDEITNAKWYYYSYAMELKAYDRNNIEVQPLACDIKVLKSLKVNTDTTQIFFNAFNKDTLNVCNFKPMGLVGITVVRNKLYLPIYHTIVFDSESDNIVLERMNKQSLLLRDKVLENKETVNAWLQAEAEKRK
jgi:hypothetical protein